MQNQKNNKLYNLVIIGAGLSGFSVAIYTARKKLKVLFLQNKLVA